MIKIYLSAFLLCITSVTFAQAQFTANNCFQLNDSSNLGFAVVSASFDDFISQTGNSYTWDFSATGTPGPWTSWTSPTTAYKFRPSAQSNHTSFASSEMNEYALVAFARDNFYTYSANQDTLYTDGFYNSSSKVYLPRIPYLTYPLSFSDSVYTHTLQTGGTAVGPGSVTRYWIYDGFGTVIMPFGTETNVYRIRTHQVDSSSVLNDILAITEELIWFRESDGIPILRFIKQGPTTIAAYYASVSGVSGITEGISESKLLVYPNPFQDKLLLSNLSDKKIIQVTLYDIQGKQMLSENNFDNNTVNTSRLNDGIYTIEITLEDNSTIHQKLIKESASH